MTQNNYDNLFELLPWDVVKFPWGTAIKHRGSKKWTALFLNSKDGQEPQKIDLEQDNINVILHDNGIEFI